MAEHREESLLEKFHGRHSSSVVDSDDEKSSRGPSAAAEAVKAKIYRLFGREKPVHKVLGGGKPADVFLWRNKKVSASTFGAVTAIWVFFELMEYHLITLVCHGLILSLAIIFLWSNATTFISKSRPHVPEVSISEDLALNVVLSLRYVINRVLVALRDIASGRDLKKFLAAAAALWVLSIIANCCSFLMLFYIAFVALYTVPVLYEKYEDRVDAFAEKAEAEFKKHYVVIHVKYLSKIPMCTNAGSEMQALVMAGDGMIDKAAYKMDVGIEELRKTLAQIAAANVNLVGLTTATSPLVSDLTLSSGAKVVPLKKRRRMTCPWSPMTPPGLLISSKRAIVPTGGGCLCSALTPTAGLAAGGAKKRRVEPEPQRQRSSLLDGSASYIPDPYSLSSGFNPYSLVALRANPARNRSKYQCLCSPTTLHYSTIKAILIALGAAKLEEHGCCRSALSSIEAPLGTYPTVIGVDHESFFDHQPLGDILFNVASLQRKTG
ncbi:hypothetical protein C4D60_Mb04t08070 [Musa balbisiana]|uniref:Reticulon-like protein n=1 Tax=Musa balbisiana TaxID=52838 RepID=A0A4S8KAG0_MUSBA|nr:hypothetical protein C4D60_Mb04t08070 [Musa balbisiana]